MSVDYTPPPPLGGPPPAEVVLSRAPLARVLAQVRFPTVLFIEDKARVAPFQADLRDEYPVFRQEAGQNLKVEITQAGPSVQTATATLWRFADVAGDWTVTLAAEAVTLETRAYATRRDFVARLERILAAVERQFSPGIVERLGIRYVTRVTGEGYERIGEMIPPGLLGVAIPEMRDHVTHAISEAAITVAEGQLLLRWGVLPANGTIDPFVLDPVDQPSWVLDIDVSSSGYADFGSAPLGARFHALAQRAYAMFRHMVTDEFLILHGGTP